MNSISDNFVHHVDNILLALGSRGKYQMFHIVIYYLVAFPCAFQLLSIVFTGRAVPHRCASHAIIFQPYGNESNINITYGECDILFSSNGTILTDELCTYGVEYQLPMDASAVSQFDLICGKAYLAKLSQTILIFGQGIGAFITTFISDRCGRKKVIVGSNLGLLVAGLLCAYAPNYVVYFLAKLFIGAFQQGTYSCSIIFALELFPTKDRKFNIIASGVSWGVAVMTMPLVSFLLANYSWRTLQAVYSMTSVFAFLQLWVCDESIRWLIANGKSEQAINTIRRAAKINGKDVHLVLQAYHGKEESKTEPLMTHPGTIRSSSNGFDVKIVNTSIANEATKLLSFLDIFKVKRLFYNALIIWSAWFLVAIAFFTIYLTSNSLASNRFLNFFLMALMEVPSNLILYFTYNRLGRKVSAITSMAVAGLGLLAAGLFKYMEHKSDVYSHLTSVAVLIALNGATAGFAVLYNYTAEIFPTNLRNQAIGASSLFGRLGGMLAPFSGLLVDKTAWAPGLVIGGCLTMVCIGFTLLPESTDKELPQTLEELQQWFKKEKEGQGLASKEMMGDNEDIVHKSL